MIDQIQKTKRETKICFRNWKSGKNWFFASSILITLAGGGIVATTSVNADQILTSSVENVSSNTENATNVGGSASSADVNMANASLDSLSTGLNATVSSKSVQARPFTSVTLADTQLTSPGGLLTYPGTEPTNSADGPQTPFYTINYNSTTGVYTTTGTDGYGDAIPVSSGATSNNNLITWITGTDSVGNPTTIGNGIVLDGVEYTPIDGTPELVDASALNDPTDGRYFVLVNMLNADGNSVYTAYQWTVNSDTMMSSVYLAQHTPVLNVKSLTLTVGNSWTPKDNYVSGTDENGNALTFAYFDDSIPTDGVAVTATDNVPVNASNLLTTPGIYTIIYSYKYLDENGNIQTVTAVGTINVRTSDMGVTGSTRAADDNSTPYVGSNGNWFIGTIDTSILARENSEDVSVSAVNSNSTNGHSIQSSTTELPETGTVNSVMSVEFGGIALLATATTMVALKRKKLFK